jgi:hypothetical protein
VAPLRNTDITSMGIRLTTLPRISPTSVLPATVAVIAR